MPTKTFAAHGINWIWYLQGTFDEVNGTVEIHFHDLWHKYDQPKHPLAEKGQTFDITEGLGRVAKSVKIMDRNHDTKVYEVTNPHYVFDYKDFSKLEAEGS